MTKLRFYILVILKLLIFTFTQPSLFAQEWSEPVNISNMPDHLNQDADMIFDNNGIIHVVWSMKMNSFFWKIMYSSSEDDGETWKKSLDLLQNTDLWMSRPHIACDSKNHLYVTYDYATGTANKMVYLITYDGHQWSEPIFVSEGMPGSDHNNVVVDNDERVFVFWNLYSYFRYYRILEGNIWSDFYCPYCDSTDMFEFADGHFLSENLLHWIGASMSYNYYGDRLQYYLFDINTNYWSGPQMPVQDTITVGIDITLNNNDLPECVYRTYPSPDDKTKYILKEGNNWSNPELVSGTKRTQINQNIAIDQNNDKHIVETAFNNSSTHLMHYHALKNVWYGTIIDSSTNFCNPTKLLFHQDKLYLIYFKDSIPGTPDDDIFFTKYDIVTNVKEETRQITELKIYPNPGSDNIYIEFDNDQQQQIGLSILDMNGKHLITLISETRPQGMYRQLWNGKDKKGKQVSAGQYLIRMKLGRNTTTGFVEIIK
jgi:hypothetical protein